MILKPPKGAMLNRGHNLARGLVGCWLMNEGGGNIVNDLSGSHNNGIITGATWAGGIYGSCLSFNGSNQWVDISDATLPAPGTSDFSIVTVLRHPRDDTSRAIFTKGRIAANECTFYKNGTDQLVFYADAGNINAAISGSNSWPDNQWFQAVAVRRSGIVTVYQNVTTTATDVTATSAITTATDWRIGASGTGDIDYAGQINYLYYYNRALSASEIAWLYREPFQMFWVDM